MRNGEDLETANIALREQVRSHIENDVRPNAYLDVEKTTSAILRDNARTEYLLRSMIIRVIMAECALAGVAMRLEDGAKENGTH